MEKQKFYAATKFAAANEETRTVDFIISSGVVDRVGDTVAAGGWDTSAYLKNPVVLWGHDRYSPPIGKASNLRLDGGSLKASATFATAEEYPLADTIFRLLKGGYLNAVSVGFRPLEWKYTDAGVDFVKQELLEFSVVSIPANPDALAIARSTGIETAHMSEVLAARYTASENPVEKGYLSWAIRAATGKGFTPKPDAKEIPRPVVDFAMHRRKALMNDARLRLA